MGKHRIQTFSIPWDQWDACPEKELVGGVGVPNLSFEKVLLIGEGFIQNGSNIFKFSNILIRLK